MEKEMKVITGHIKVKRRYGDRFFRERVSQVVRRILTELYPDANEIAIKFYSDGLPSVSASQINHVFIMQDSMPQMIA